MPFNINIPVQNFSLGPESGFFYYVSNTLNALIKLETDGTVIQVYPIQRSRLRGTITELHWDGSHFWTMEDLPSQLGLVIKRWRITPVQTAQGLPPGVFPVPAPTDFTWQDEITLINAPNLRYVSKAFCVEHYHRFLDGSFVQGQTTLRLNDVSELSTGDTITIGPSTAGSFTGFQEDVLVTNVNPTTRFITIGSASGLENQYTDTDPVSFTKSVFLFNDHAFSGEEDRKGAILQYAWPSKNVILTGNGMRYNNVGAADFDFTSLFWVRADQIMEVNIGTNTFDVASSNESNLREDDQTTIIEVFDMITDLSNNQHLKLQNRETVEDVPTGNYTTFSWGNDFNYQVQPTLTVVNSISLNSDTRFSIPFPSGDHIQWVAEVRDQYNFPVFNETIQFSAAMHPLSDAGIPGTFDPTTGVTTTSGTVETEYTPSVTPNPIIVEIQAQVL